MGRRNFGILGVLTRDIGGMPAWGLGLAGALTICLAGFFAATTTAAHTPPPYTSPKGASSPSIPAPMPFVVFLGDSYTQGVGGGGTTWPDLIGSKHGWDVANLGLGGTGYIRTAGMDGCGRETCGNYAQASTEILGTPQMIFISGGRNDLGLPVPKLEAAADALFGDLRQRYPAAQIFVVNPWFDDDPPPTSPDAFVAALKKAAKSNGVAFLDTGQPLLGKPKLISSDGIHPNADGYHVLADAVDQALRLAATGKD